MQPSQKNNNSRRHTAPKRRNTKNKSAYSKVFLGIALLVMIVFLAIVCIALSPNDKTNADDWSDSSTLSDTSAENTSNTDSQTQTTSETQVQTTKSQTTTSAGKPSDTSPSGSSANSVQVIKIDADNWELTLVNTKYRLPDGFVPEKLLTVVNDCRLDSKVAPHYIDMYNAALADDVKLTPFSGYRSYEVQKRNYNNKINFYVNQGYDKSAAAVKAATIIMPPGSSEHNLGYAMDIVTCDTWFENTSEFTWLRDNAYKYGFIMRYAKEKQDITGVIYEPWHWRYVGVKVATELYQTRDANGVEMCLEEYLNK